MEKGRAADTARRLLHGRWWTAPAGGGAGAARAARDAPAPVTPARQRLALAQAALLSALVAGTPVPAGFDRVRLGVQARALAGKRADVVAKVAPGTGDTRRGIPAVLPRLCAEVSDDRGLPAGRLDFVEHLMRNGRPLDAEVRIELREWWLERSGPTPRFRSVPGRGGPVRPGVFCCAGDPLAAPSGHHQTERHIPTTLRPEM